MRIREICNTKESEIPGHHKIQFHNGVWFDVEIDSYIYVQYVDEGPWILIRKDLI